MDKLSSTLIAKIEARPLNTFIRSSDSLINQSYQESIKKGLISGRTGILTPKIFNGRDIWHDFLSPVMNQGNCGSCWAFATTSCLADKFNILSNGLMHIQLSPTKLILCDWEGRELETNDKDINTILNFNKTGLKEGSCFGNSLIDAWRYLYILGTPTEECIPYSMQFGKKYLYPKLADFSKTYQLPLCQNVTGPFSDMCSDYKIDLKTGVEEGTPARMYRAYHYYSVPGVEKDGGSEEDIKRDIYLFGPVTTGMQVYPDFYTFDAKNTVYSWNGSGPQVGGHAIELVGWGEDNGIPYWYVKNSWGEDWGDGGYFKIVRGKNMCQIEENVMSGMPDFFFPQGSVVSHDKYLWSETEKDDRQRHAISNKLDIEAGGIDPSSGYSRRVQIKYPWLDTSRPVKLNSLPDFSSFVAGEITVKKSNNYIYYIIGGGVLLLLITIIVILVLKTKKK